MAFLRFGGCLVWKDRAEKASRVIGRIDELLALASDERVKSELQSARRIPFGQLTIDQDEPAAIRLEKIPGPQE